MTTDRRFRVTTVSVLYFTAALFLTAYSARNAHVAAAGTAALNEVQRPLQSVTVKTFSSISNIWNDYVALVDLRKEYGELQDKVAVLEQDKAKLLELDEENKRLKKLLNAADQGALPVLEARVIAYDASNWVQAVTVNRGSADGIASGMPVMTAEGVIGQVIAAGYSSAKVLLITDHSSGVDALLENSRVRGIAEGLGEKSLRWKFVLEEDEIKIGDRVVTSGMDGIYPPGLFIGRVSTVDRNEAGMFQRIEIAPAVNMARLEEVLIVKQLQNIPKPTLTEKKK